MTTEQLSPEKIKEIEAEADRFADRYIVKVAFPSRWHSIRSYYIEIATSQFKKHQEREKILIELLDKFKMEAIKIQPSDLIVDTQQFIEEIETALKQYNESI